MDTNNLFSMFMQNDVNEIKEHSRLEVVESLNDIVNLRLPKNVQDLIDEYEKLRQEEKIIEKTFPAVDQDGNLYATQNDVKFLLKNHEITGNGVSERLRARLLEQKYNVMVTDIVTENGSTTVYLSQVAAKRKARTEIINAIRAALADHKKMVLPARVTRIDDAKGNVVLDVCNVGIVGLCKRNNWALVEIKNLQDEGVRTGQEVMIQIIGYTRHNSEDAKGRPAKFFMCSRKAVYAHRNPYEGIENRFSAGSLIVIRATDTRNPHHFFGRVDGLENIDVYCQKPKDMGDKNGVDIIEGHYYMAYVYEVNSKTKHFRARVFKEAGSKADITASQINDVVAQEREEYAKKIESETVIAQ